MKRDLFFNAIALAMGTAGIVLTILKTPAESISILFGIAIFCLAINGLEKHKR